MRLSALVHRSTRIWSIYKDPNENGSRRIVERKVTRKEGVHTIHIVSTIQYIEVQYVIPAIVTVTVGRWEVASVQTE